ncbi:MAG: hypothetical protein KDC98_18215, partial [Planctomycetes bacterium]|nr:hypothetical protein [Planctomycetota bacterium]
MQEWLVGCYQALGLPVDEEDLLAVAKKALTDDHATAARRLWLLRKLRGADSDPTMVADITAVTRILDDTADVATTAPDRPTVQRARDRIATIDAVAQRIERAAAALEARQRADLEAMPRYFAELKKAQAARDTIAGLAGAGQELGQIDALLLRGQAALGIGDD